MLREHGSAAVRVFVVWEPILVTDFFPPVSTVLGRLSDTRVQQYWDPRHALSGQLAKDARSPQPVQDCCVKSGVLWDLAAVYPAGVSWTDRMPAAVVFNGPVADLTSELAATLRP